MKAGTLGHIYIDDPDNPGRRMIEFQFVILSRRKSRYRVHFFSWLDGGPSTFGYLSEEDLLSDNCKLFSSREEWLAAAERNERGQEDGLFWDDLRHPA